MDTCIDDCMQQVNSGHFVTGIASETANSREPIYSRRSIPIRVDVKLLPHD